MASGTEIANALAGAMADQITVQLDSGDVGAIINIYTGAPPADCETAPSGTLLATLPMSDPAFTGFTNLSPNARVTAASITSDSSADTSGTAGYFRGYSASTSQIDANKVTCFIQGTAGEAADSTDLTLDDKTIIVGGTVAITAWTIDIPEA